jgi:hypothetical protein
MLPSHKRQASNWIKGWAERIRYGKEILCFVTCFALHMSVVVFIVIFTYVCILLLL